MAHRQVSEEAQLQTVLSASPCQDTVKIVSRADQARMGESLGKNSQRFAAVTDLLRKESPRVRIAEHLLEHQANFLDAARAGQRFDQPEAANIAVTSRPTMPLAESPMTP